MKTRIAASFLIFLLAAVPARADVYTDWDALEKKVRDNAIAQAEARIEMVRLHARLVKEAPRGASGTARDFPVKGYGLRDVGGKGSGYVRDSYDYYQGKKHTGHPAHDIFIVDSNHDSLDDHTGKPVDVVAFAGGVVTATGDGWLPTSDTRGGNYVWIYDPGEDAFYAYAHLLAVTVKPGQVVNAGQTLGYVGRTGLNAWVRRSQTHLHFMRVDYDGGKMTPRNTWDELKRAAKKSR